MERTRKKTAVVIAKTIKEIVKKYKRGMDAEKLINEVCQKNEINEKTIRTIARWDKEIKKYCE